jgi:hypothetical protein
MGFVEVAGVPAIARTTCSGLWIRWSGGLLQWRGAAGRRNHGGCGGWNHGDPDHRMGNSELETWIMTHQKNAPHKMGFSLCCLISPCLKNKVYPEEKTSQIWLFVSFPFWIAMLDDIYHFQTDPSPIYFMAKILTYQTALRPPFLRFAGSEVWYHKLLTPSWYST